MKFCLKFLLTSRYLEYYAISGILDILCKTNLSRKQDTTTSRGFHTLSLITAKLRKLSVFKVVHF